MTKNRVLRVNFDLDGEPMSQYFIKFMLRIISRLLDIRFSAKSNKDIHYNLRKSAIFPDMRLEDEKIS